VLAFTTLSSLRPLSTCSVAASRYTSRHLRTLLPQSVRSNRLPKMTTTVEHALLNVKADYDAAAERDALKTLVQQPGFQAVLRAVAEEDKTKLLWLVEWESYDAHKAFMDSKAYGPFMETLGGILDTSKGSPVEMAHYELPTPVSKIISSDKPMLERFVFTSDSSSDDLKAACDGMKDAIEDGKSPTIWGTAREDSKRVSFLVAWASVEEHLAYKKDSRFLKALPALGAAATKDTSMMHFKLEMLKP